MAIDLEELKRHLAYDPETGIFGRLISVAPLAQKGGKVGREERDGRTQIMVGKRLYMANRLAWFYVNGTWPVGKIRHRNGDLADTRISNLFEETHSRVIISGRRRKNNTSGRQGVSFDKRRGRWVAHIRIDGRQKRLGSSADIDKAIAMREKYEAELMSNGN